MKFRRRARPDILGFQIAPFVDVLIVLLVFFIVTWNFALTENELEVKIPSANNAKEPQPYVGQVVVNVKKDGTIVFNRNTLTRDELVTKLTQLSKLFPDQAVILRGDREAPYDNIVNILDLCRKANIWNIAFATAKPEE